MRHRKAGRRLSRPTAHREAMLCNLACSLIEHGRVTTTVAKAKEARRLVERCITAAKKGTAAFAAVEDQLPPLKEESTKIRQRLEATTDEKQLLDVRRDLDRVGGKIAALQASGVHYRRLCLKRLRNKAAVKQLFDEIAPRYGDRSGGYTRILKAGFRKGDNAPVALFELV